jgi:hypothetical protein
MFSPRAYAFLLLLFLLSCFSGYAAPQSSASLAIAAAAHASATAALRDTLVAACAHDENSFRKFLTARNLQSFNGMTAAARTELLKRFVLLDDPGTPSVSGDSTSGYLIRCQTPQGAAAIHIGAPELRDNVAFLPVSIGDAADPDPAHAQKILMGMVREDGRWKVLSIGVLLLDLPSLAVQWDQQQSAQNEKAAFESLKNLASAIEAYRRAYTRLPETLSELGPPKKGHASAAAAGLVNPDLASGQVNGYSFRFVIVGASDVGAPAKYELSATPSPYGRAGKLSFFRDSSGVYHAADHQGAVGSELDPTVK